MARTLFSTAPPRNIKVYLFLAFSVVLLALFVFSNILIRRLGDETERTSRMFASLCAAATYPATKDTVMENILTGVIDNIQFPIVLTDISGTPRAWKQVGVDPNSVSNASLDSMAAGHRPSPVIEARIERVQAAAAKLDKSRPPIPLTDAETKGTVGLVHWGEPHLLTILRYVPYLSVGIIIILLGLTFWGARGIRLAESRSIWVGLAKETAHQLGTPLSSLLGWIELLRERVRMDPESEVRIERDFLMQTLDEMHNDVDRLTKVSARFSQIGSQPALTPQDLAPVVAEAVGYLKRRLPDLGRKVTIAERYGEVPPVNANRELLEWVVENLLVNAMTALEGKPGRIEVTLARRPEVESVELEVMDTGKGMSLEQQKRAFDPGFSTKKRGWGLGLALAKRIIEDYHGGRIAIRQSAPGKGTTFVISFPT
ncbi:MAG TPA: HAMP domain-containing sensor histidine kinase [Candidatus Eisenbacteria bacterium]|nr:HAMP domain-containing sensor histidine kinase [Candidatus Eisenbacteria bacterium]